MLVKRVLDCAEELKRTFLTKDALIRNYDTLLFWGFRRESLPERIRPTAQTQAAGSRTQALAQGPGLLEILGCLPIRYSDKLHEAGGAFYF